MDMAEIFDENVQHNIASFKKSLGPTSINATIQSTKLTHRKSPD